MSSFDPDLADPDTLPSSTGHRVEKWRVRARTRVDRLSTLIRTPFSRKLVATKATLEARHVIQPSLPTLGANEMRKQKPTFLTLPPEIRLQIYELLFQVDHRKMGYAKWRVGNIGSNFICVGLDTEKGRSCSDTPSIKPRILRTCKQIYQEALPILYSRNAFYISYSMYAVNFFRGIKTNVKYITTIRLSIDWGEPLDPGDWLRILNILAEDATGLKSLQVAFTLFCYKMREVADAHMLFINSLAKIRQVKLLHVSGYYDGLQPMNWSTFWPAYLQEVMGVAAQIHVSEHEWTCILQRKQECIWQEDSTDQENSETLAKDD
ncbi:hypothetical protein FQN50_004820 [Emmonsiellopsis sp. PD_5]|nr:hypothetical protein FQN50_004820 [Emmonsiellopsis sp. PD_5]